MPDVMGQIRRSLHGGQEVAKRTLMNPAALIQSALRRSGSAPFSKKVFWDALDRPHFGYGVWQAAYQARHQGIRAISVVEFGVAGGNGLVALEDIADAAARESGVEIRCYGFDTGSGMPPPVDYRDLPYLWAEGDFAMDPDALRSRLRHAELILGDVAETAPEFAGSADAPPVGFVSFDLDYYSSTVSALKIFDTDPERLLPRVFCYFDDVIGSDVEIHCRYVGELLAIDEFNDVHDDQKLAPIWGLARKRPVPAIWNDQLWVHHSFDHPDYGTFIPQPRPDVFDLSLTP